MCQASPAAYSAVRIPKVDQTTSMKRAFDPSFKACPKAPDHRANPASVGPGGSSRRAEYTSIAARGDGTRASLKEREMPDSVPDSSQYRGAAKFKGLRGGVAPLAALAKTDTGFTGLAGVPFLSVDESR